jgi:hypothetical protein
MLILLIDAVDLLDAATWLLGIGRSMLCGKRSNPSSHFAESP